MKLRVILTAVPVLALLGCGSDSGMFTLSTGTYVFSNTIAVAPDNCNLGTLFRDGSTVPITVSGANATFAFGSVDSTKHPVATISGNSLNQGSKTFDFDNNTLPAGQRFDCVETITEAVSGSLVANDQAQVTLT